MSKISYVNGRYVTWEEAKVNVMDYGLLYGYGVYETMRSYNGRVLKLNDHLVRLRNSLKATGINYKVDKIPGVIERLLRMNNLEDAYIRVTVTAGEGKARLNLGKQKPSVIVIVDKAPNVKEKQEKGVKVGFSKVRHYTGNPLGEIKSTNYLLTALRKQDAIKRKLDDLIVLNELGNITEATTSNLFIVDSKGNLITPKITLFTEV